MSDDTPEDLSGYSMLDLFRIEVESQVDVLAKGLLSVSQGAASAATLGALMRAAHSIKGAARMVDVPLAVSLAHEMEECLVGVQRGQLRLQRGHVDTLLRSTDALLAIAAGAVNGDPIVIEGLARQTGLLVADIREMIGASAPADDAQFLQPTQAVEFSGVAVVDLRPELEAVTVKTADRVIRIDADRMTRIMGVTGELLVESRRLVPFSGALQRIRKRHDELAQLADKVADTFPIGPAFEAGRAHIKELQTKLALARQGLSACMVELDDFSRRSSNLSNRVYREVVASRMRPFGDAVHGFERLVHDLGRVLGKDSTLRIHGQDTLVDRDVLERLKAPLNHLLRNALDHGIEAPAERIARGKPPTAYITVSAHHRAGMLRITLEDDGRGIDLEAIREKIIRKGLVSGDLAHALGSDELLEFLYLPDFSTRDQVTDISGRGVGLDVVRDAVHAFGGSIKTVNIPGQGARFVLQLPLTLSVLSTLVVDVAGERYAFPMSRVDRVLQLAADAVVWVEGKQHIAVDGVYVPLMSASVLLELGTGQRRGAFVNVVVIGDDVGRYGVLVDGLVGRRELSVQPMDTWLGGIRDISAGAVGDDGNAVLMLDVDDLTSSFRHRFEQGQGEGADPVADEPRAPEYKRVLVVDDSLTVRELERALLESHSYIVDTAVDGVDGWNAVRTRRYDLVITDVDMPRMDGIELVSSIRQDLHLKSTPIMIVSYKDRPEDRKRGLDVGADYYLTKGSFHDSTMMDAVIDLIGEAHS